MSTLPAPPLADEVDVLDDAPSLVSAGLAPTRRPVAQPFAERLPAWLVAIHWFLILNLAIQCGYATFQVFWVLQPEGTFGPMFGHAMGLDPDLMMARRMYAQEGWLAFVGLAVYLGVTEVLPRRWPQR